MLISRNCRENEPQSEQQHTMNGFFRGVDEVGKAFYSGLTGKINNPQNGSSSVSTQSKKAKKRDIPTPIVKIPAANPDSRPVNDHPMLVYKILVAGDGYGTRKAQFAGDLISHYFNINTSYWEYRIEEDFLTPPISITPAPLPAEFLFPRSHKKFEPPPWYEDYAGSGTINVQLQITHNPSDGIFYHPGGDAAEDYEKTADAIILLYDVNDRGSFYNMDLCLKKLARKQRKEESESAAVIIGNTAHLTYSRQVSEQEGSYRGKQLGRSWREVNLKTGEGADGLLEEVVGEIWKKKWRSRDELE